MQSLVAKCLVVEYVTYGLPINFTCCRLLFLVDKNDVTTCALLTFRNSTDGIYSLKSYSTGEYYDVYCHMSEIATCGGGGWTLVMKVDGNKVLFSNICLIKLEKD